MQLLTTCEGLREGDVLVVAMDLTDKQTGKPYVWRWYGVVKEALHTKAHVIRVGENKRTAVSALRQTLHLLDFDEWPDGVHAFRMRMILEGLIDPEM